MSTQPEGNAAPQQGQQQGQQRAKPPVALDLQGGVRIDSLDQAYRFAVAVVQSGLAPKGDTPDKVMIKLVAGAELGLPPMRALAMLTVINGRLGIMGEAALAKIRSSQAFEYVRVGNEGEGDDHCGFVEAKRRGEAGALPVVRFTVADAKRARLWEGKSVRHGDPKDSPWVKYPDDMLIWKAVSRFGKRYAPDVLMGFEVSQVAADLPPIERKERRQEPPRETDPLLAGADITDAVIAPAPTLESQLAESVDQVADQGAAGALKSNANGGDAALPATLGDLATQAEVEPGAPSDVQP